MDFSGADRRDRYLGRGPHTRRGPAGSLGHQNRELVREVYVTDSIGNGFRLNYVTEKSVTKARYEEICSRPATRDSINKMAELAPQRFGDMLYTDIYDFADFAKCFDPADVQIHNIFVFGRQKKGLYFGENPRIKNWAKHYDPETEQGILYIKDEDIYCNDSLRRKNTDTTSVTVCINSLTLMNISAISPKTKGYSVQLLNIISIK